MKVILAHDSFTQYGGAERVFEAMHECYPYSPVYTLAVDDAVKDRLSGWDLVLSPLQWWYNRVHSLQKLFPIIPVILRFFKTEPADVLLSSSSAYLKGLIKPAGGIHINYCHTPTRFVWSDFAYALREIPLLLRPLAWLYLQWLKQWDLKQAGRVDYFIANSKEVQKRIKKYYHRDAPIIYPFIDTAFWKPTKTKADYFLIAGRLAPYKQHDMVIEVFNILGIPLHVVGTGRYEEYLKTLAKPNIKFLGKVSDEVLRDEYSGALGFIYPQLEDFGIMPLESASCGTPTIALGAGGSLETVIDGVTGKLLNPLNAQTLSDAITNWQPENYETDKLVAHAREFSKERFQEQLTAFVNEVKL